jgi:hypothetical protein
LGKIFEIDHENRYTENVFENNREHQGFLRKRPPFQNPGNALPIGA